MFQELTSNIVSYQRQLKSESSEDHSDENPEETEVDLETMSAEVYVEGDDKTDEEESSGVANLAYRQDDVDTSDVDEISTDFAGSQDSSPQNRPNHRLCKKKFSTWPSGLVVYADTGKLKKNENNLHGSFSTGTSPIAGLKSPDHIWAISDGRVIDETQPASPTNNSPVKRIHVRKTSDEADALKIRVKQPNNAKRSKSHDYRHGDYFKRNLKMKDNRVKSTIRRHALSGYQSQIPVDYLDECTVEALSKDDLLILWKKSEIEMQRRLNDILVRNRSLSVAIDYLATHQGDKETAEEV